jgi:hypothetical protein
MKLGGTQSRSGRGGEEKKFKPLSGIEPRSSNPQPSLYAPALIGPFLFIHGTSIMPVPASHTCSMFSKVLIGLDVLLAYTTAQPARFMSLDEIFNGRPILNVSKLAKNIISFHINLLDFPLRMKDMIP